MNSMHMFFTPSLVLAICECGWQCSHPENAALVDGPANEHTPCTLPKNAQALATIRNLSILQVKV